MIFSGIGTRALEVLLAIGPIVLIYIVLTLMGMKSERDERRRVTAGFIMSYVGLVLFLQGVTVSFRPVGEMLGDKIAGSPYAPLLPIIGFVIGFVVAFAEPAVWVLNKQVDELTAGSIHKTTMLLTLSIGVAFAVMLAMIKVMFQISLWWIVLPGYTLIFLLFHFGKVKPTFAAIAFDSGGVATGPMCSTFVMSFSVGAAKQIPGANPMRDGFGMVALVAMAPIIAIMVLNFLYEAKKVNRKKENKKKKRGN